MISENFRMSEGTEAVIMLNNSGVKQCELIDIKQLRAGDRVCFGDYKDASILFNICKIKDSLRGEISFKARVSTVGSKVKVEGPPTNFVYTNPENIKIYRFLNISEVLKRI